LWAKGLSARDIHKEMFSVYGGKCLLHNAVSSWVEKFSLGRSKAIEDARPGCPVVDSDRRKCAAGGRVDL
jgi:hypothetical protein